MRTALALALLLASGVTLAQSSATYRVTLDATWSAQTFPSGFPGSAHFSPLVGAVHNADARLWEAGGTASGGIEAMAESGSTGALLAEIDAIGGGAILEAVTGGAIGTSPGAVSMTITATEAHALVTIVTMIAPSPDWFVGTESLDLRDDAGGWQSEVVVPMFAWDAGTDSGTGYTSGNADTNPREPIAPIQRAPFVVGGSVQPLGTMTFTLQTVVANEDAPEASGELSVWPQPIHTSGQVRVQTDASGDADLALYDVRGRRVQVLHTGPLASGAHAFRLDASSLAPGVYLARLATESGVRVQRVVVAR